jgi:inhibitor of cysteine peptidase
MKKIVAVVALILTLSMLAAGCGGDDVKTYSDAGAAIKVKVNGEFIIALDSNPTTGYSWKVLYEESQFELVSDDYVQDEKETMMTGVGGTQYLRVKALKSGDYEITMNYQRSWESEPVQQVVFSVKVS